MAVVVLLCELLKFVYQGSQLADVETVLADLLHSCKLVRGWLNEVHDLLIDAEVHELDAELLLYLGLLLNGGLDYSALKVCV